MVVDSYSVPDRRTKALVCALVFASMLVVLVTVYYIGAFNTVNAMEVTFRDFGEVTLEFNGFVYPKCLDALFGGK